jgi:hypothetical protein
VNSPMVVERGMQKCDCSSLKGIVENGGKRHMVAVSDDHCESTNSSTASCKEGNLGDC